MSSWNLGLLGASSLNIIPNAYEHLQTIIPTGSQSQVSFTNLATAYSSTYKHLQIRYTARSQRAGVNTDSLVMRFTASSGSHVAHTMFNSGSSVGSLSDANSPHMYLGEFPSGNFAANVFQAGIIDILDAFSTNKNKIQRTLNGFTGTTNDIRLSSGMYYGDTAALTSVFISSANGGNFTTTSRFSLYGLKG